MITLFSKIPAQAPRQAPRQAPEPQHQPKPTRKFSSGLVALPVSMLVVAAAVELAAWHQSATGRSARNTLPAQLSAGLPASPAPGLSSLPPALLPKTPSRSELAKARAAKARALETYTNEQFGISVSYPRSYSLLETAALEDHGSSVVEHATLPGEQVLARIELPDNLYPRTDFLAGYLSLSVNPTLSPGQCGQPGGLLPEADLHPVNFAGISFKVRENAVALQGTRTAWREYATYSGSVCYEVELSVETLDDETAARVDPNRVFRRLENVLRTFKIEPRISSSDSR
jgi:hypothetical protein